MRGLLIINCFMFLVGCWGHQQHDITEPPVAVYTLSGVVKDIDSGLPLPGIEISIYNKSIDKDYEIRDKTVTDDSGRYQFVEEISPGSCILSAIRDGCTVLSKNLMIEYRDRTYDIELPKVLISEGIYDNLPEGHVTGICWKNASTLAIIDYWKTFYEGYEFAFSKIWELTISTGSYRLLSQDLFSPFYHGLTYAFSYYWSLQGDSLYQLRGSDMEIQNKFKLTAADLSWDGQNLYAARGSKIYKIIDLEKGLHEEYLFNQSNLSGIAWDGIHFWATDKYYYFVYQFNRNLEIIGTYLAFDQNFPYRPIFSEYIAFDSSKRLWMAVSDKLYYFKIS
jgi:hypothetical protein